jgi:hypothetical protein
MKFPDLADMYLVPCARSLILEILFGAIKARHVNPLYAWTTLWWRCRWLRSGLRTSSMGRGFTSLEARWTLGI